ncbi:MAG: FliI/YscN family ATPase [Pseudomonadota bacterium]
MVPELEGLMWDICAVKAARPVGRVVGVRAGLLSVAALGDAVQVGMLVEIRARSGVRLTGEVLALGSDGARILPAGPLDGVGIGDEVLAQGPLRIAPCAKWIGRILDARGQPMDGRPLPRGPVARSVLASPPNPVTRKPLGQRLETGMQVFNTLLPVVKAQRIGLFSGSGVGKSSLLAHFATQMQADVVVIALIGERGRELGDFAHKALGVKGMARSVIVAATSDQSPLERRRCALTAMTVAEHFRDQGKQVLLLADSVTRFAEAHREIAVMSGEAASLRGFPASTAHRIMSLCERAGPGAAGQGDITAVFSVLVAGSDMEEPVADMMRGVLDGHVVLEREIAERGRFPAINPVKSVSRSLPDAASAEENHLISIARQLLGAYEDSALMIRAGLYSEGGDPVLDTAVRAFGDLDAFVGAPERIDAANSFKRLELILRKAGALSPRGQGA